MEYSIQYKYEKMLKSRHVLAASRKTIRVRVYESYQHFWLLKEDEFQGDARKVRQDIQHLITKMRAKEGYIIPHNIRYMPLARAEEIASLILQLYDIVANEYLKDRS